MEICRHGCLDHCQLSGSVAHYIQERKDQVRPQYIQSTISSVISNDENNSADKGNEGAVSNVEHGDGSLYDDVIQNGDEMTSIGGHFLDVEKSIPKAQAQTSDRLPSTVAEVQHDNEAHSDNAELSKPFMVNIETSHSPQSLNSIQNTSLLLLFKEPPRVTRYDSDQDQFPHGPRNLEEDDSSDAMPLSANARRKRSVVVSDRKARSADVGVSGIYEVISEADLAFSPDAHAEAVTVFQGRIREEVVYGICLPMPGFSALFIVVALSAVVSALVAGAMLHRLQAQREVAAGGRKNNADVHANNGWLPYGLLRVRCTAQSAHPEELQQKEATNVSQIAADPSVERG